MHKRAVRRPGVIGSICLLLFAACIEATAQEKRTQTPRGPVTEALLQSLEKLPHTGSVDEALVGIRVTGTKSNGTPMAPRYGNGFVLRCDGFLVVPFDLFNLSPDSTPSAPETQTIHVTFRPGSDREQKVTMGRRSRWFIDNMRRMGFTVFRTEGAVHVPALRSLLPDTLKPGDTVEVVWRAWDESAGKFGDLVRKPARLAAKPEGVSWQCLAEESSDHPGRIRFSEPLDGVPAGAVVLGPEEKAVGVIPGGGPPARRDSFVSFASLSLVTNCAGAVKTPDTLFQDAQVLSSPQPVKVAGEDKPAASTTSSKMVHVPGGPVIVPKAMLADQSDMEGEPVACVAPFEIDRLEVTNGEYLAFWNALDEKQRNNPAVRQALYPLGWAPVGEPFPNSIAGLPVLGVPLPGAEAYAKSQGKRLPTPYEWAKAALGPKGETQTPDWIKRYILERQQAWVELCRIHAAYLKSNSGLLEFARHPIDDNGKPIPAFDEEFFTLPWVVLRNGYAAERLFSFQATEHIISELIDGWHNPTSVIPVGERTYDVSPYGAQDMLLNAWELYQPNPAAPVFRAPRYLAVEWDTAYNDVWRPQPFVPWRNTIELPPGHKWGLPWPWSEVRLSRLYKRTMIPRVEYRPEPWDRRGWVPIPTRGVVPPTPVEMDFLLLVDNLNTMSRMTMPLGGWALQCGSLYEIGTVANGMFGQTTESVDVGRVETTFGDQPASKIIWPHMNKTYPWAAGDLHFTRELGYPPATNGTILIPAQNPPKDIRYRGPIVRRGRLQPPSPPDMFYILPVGFRCAR